MAYDLDSLKKGGNKPGQTKEQSDKGELDAGLYRHPATGEELITIADPLFGNPQADAAIRVGFEYVRPAKPEEIKSIIEVNREERVNQSEEAASDRARLDQLELAELRREKAERLKAEELSTKVAADAEENRDKTAADESAEDAKAAGIQAVAARESEGEEVAPVEETPAEDVTETPVEEEAEKSDKKDEKATKSTKK